MNNTHKKEYHLPYSQQGLMEDANLKRTGNQSKLLALPVEAIFTSWSNCAGVRSL